MRSRTLLFLVGCIALSACVAAGQDAAARTSELIAALDKTKHKKKEKKDLSIEVYVEVKNQPAIRNNAYDYSGNYGSEDGSYTLALDVGPGGAAGGSGYDTMLDGGGRIAFTLRDGRIEGALLTATKSYENGESRKFEAVFVEQTVSTGKNPSEIASRNTRSGLGFILHGFPPKADGSPAGGWTSRVFLERK